MLASAIDARFFGARADGEIGAYCELYSVHGTGQIENVLTLEHFRNRGLARALVLRALGASRGRETTSRSSSPTATTGQRSSTASSASTRSASSTTSCSLRPSSDRRVRVLSPPQPRSDQRSAFRALVSDCLPWSTPSKRSPCFSTRARTASIVNAAGSRSSFTSSQRSGVETGAPGRGRTE